MNISAASHAPTNVPFPPPVISDATTLPA